MENNDTNLKLANVIFDLAKNAEESGKYEDAIKSYKEVLNVFEQALGAEDEKTKEVYTNIGMCYKALGKNEEALTYLTKALSNGNTASVVIKQETAIAKQETNEEELEYETKNNFTFLTEEEIFGRIKQAEEYCLIGLKNNSSEHYYKAFHILNESLIIYNKQNGKNDNVFQELYEGLSAVSLALGDRKKAVDYLQKALKHENDESNKNNILGYIDKINQGYSLREIRSGTQKSTLEIINDGVNSINQGFETGQKIASSIGNLIKAWKGK